MITSTGKVGYYKTEPSESEQPQARYTNKTLNLRAVYTCH